MKVNDNLSILILPEKPEMNVNGEAGQRNELKLETRVKPEKWDYENEKAKGTSPADLKINSLITAVSTSINNSIFDLFYK